MLSPSIFKSFKAEITDIIYITALNRKWIFPTFDNVISSLRIYHILFHQLHMPFLWFKRWIYHENLYPLQAANCCRNVKVKITCSGWQIKALYHWSIYQLCLTGSQPYYTSIWWSWEKMHKMYDFIDLKYFSWKCVLLSHLTHTQNSESFFRLF